MFVRVLKTLTFALSFISFLIGLFGVLALLQWSANAGIPVSLYPLAFPYMLVGFVVIAIVGWLMIMTVIIEKRSRGSS